MYYEINVAEKARSNRFGTYAYKHFFATAPRSIQTREKLIQVHAALAKAFPEPDYDISITFEKTIGTGVDINKIIDEVEAEEKRKAEFKGSVK